MLRLPAASRRVQFKLLCNAQIGAHVTLCATNLVKSLVRSVIAPFWFGRRWHCSRLRWNSRRAKYVSRTTIRTHANRTHIHRWNFTRLCVHKLAPTTVNLHSCCCKKSKIIKEIKMREGAQHILGRSSGILGCVKWRKIDSICYLAQFCVLNVFFFFAKHMYVTVYFYKVFIHSGIP